MAKERANAKTATPITIAVSTSAWGTGSTIRAASISGVEKMGAVPPLIYPMEIRNKFTPVSIMLRPIITLIRLCLTRTI
jgi:hypothetical protein